MVSNAKIPASYNSRTVFNKAKAKFTKAIRSNIGRAISAQLWEVYQDNPSMHGSLLSNAAKFNLMIQKMKDMVSSREVGSMLLKDFLPNVKEMKIQEEVEIQEEEVEKEEYPSMVVKLEPAEIKEKCPVLVKEECPVLVKEECPVVVKEECPVLVKEECPVVVKEEYPAMLIEECPPPDFENFVNFNIDEGDVPSYNDIMAFLNSLN